jgi:hypothetical protein
MIALWIISLHLLGDYVTQTNAMAARKLTDWRIRTLHVAVYTLPFAVLAVAVGGTWQPWIFPLLVFVPHWITDCRRWASPDPWPPKPIMVDQTIHALCLAIAATLCYGLA